MPTQNEKSYPLDYKIDGLDIRKGMRNFGGEADIYFPLLHSFATNTKPLLETLIKTNVDDAEDYIFVIHSIKGSCYSIYAEKIGDRAKTLEKAARNGDFAFVRRETPIFAEDLRKMLAQIDEMFAMINEGRPMREKPDREVLVKLQGACRKYDVNVAYAAMMELLLYEYEQDDALVRWLDEQMERLNFKGIAQRLTVMGIG